MAAPLPALPAGNTQICVTIPDSAQWRQIYLGALVILQKWWYYDVTSEIDAEDAIQRIQECMYLTESGNNCMDCQTIIDCINDTPELQLLIADVAKRGGGSAGMGTSPVIAGTTLIDCGVAGGNDFLFGACRQFLGLMDDLAADFIEIANNNTNAVARIGSLIAALPIVETLPIDDVLLLGETLLEDLQDNYEAQNTVTYQNEVACALFCRSLLDCELSIQDTFDFFNDRLSGGFFGTSIQEVVNWLVTGSFPGTQLVDAWYAFVCQVILKGLDIVNIDESILTQLILSFYNDPDPDWDILCACGGWDEIIFTNDALVNFALSYGNAMSNRIVTVENPASSGNRRLQCIVTFPARDIWSIEMLGRCDFSASDRQFKVLAYQASTLVATYTATVPASAEALTLKNMFTGVLNCDELRVQINATLDGSNAGFGGLYEVRLAGDGSNPF